MHLRSAPLLAAVAVGATLLLSGCSELSPQTTQLQYAPSDGAQVDLGDVGVRNALFVVADDATDASPANAVLTLVNSGTAPASVELSAGNGGSTTVQVPANGSVAVGPGQETTWELAQVGAIAGLSVPMTITAGQEQVVLQVPVLDGTLPEYATLAPSAPASPAATSPAANSPGATPATAPSPSAPPPPTTAAGN